MSVLFKTVWFMGWFIVGWNLGRFIARKSNKGDNDDA